MTLTRSRLMHLCVVTNIIATVWAWALPAHAGQSETTAVQPAPAQSTATPALQAARAPSRPVVRVDWSPRPTLVLGRLRLSPRAALRGDSRRSDAPLDDELDAGLDLAKRRVGLDGAVGDYADFQIEYELDDDDPWRDVFVNVSPIRQVQAQYGKFKLPFGLEENTGSANLDFAYRSMVSRALAPGRDRGAMLHGQVLDQFIRYEVGHFGHDGANAATRSVRKVSGGNTLALRVSANPIRKLDDSIDDFRVGIAITRSVLTGEGISSIRGQTTLGLRFWESIWSVSGMRRRRGVEVRWRPGPFSIQAEHMQLIEERRGLSVEDTDLAPIEATGWYVSGTWAVTGEAKEDGLAATGDPIGHGVGAIEVAARIEQLRFRSRSTEGPSLSPRADAIVGNETRATTVGVNWYLNRWLKLQINLVREAIRDAAQGPLPSQPLFWSRVLRLQMSL